jgi:hypothetical protein
MTMDKTTRRSFLKTGAIVAAPLARLEDERAVEALQRKFVRYLNGTGDCGEFVAPAGSVDLGEGLRSIADTGHEPILELSADGRTATARVTCKVERETEFAGDTTLERMARFQGQGSHRFAEERVLATEFVKGNDGWRIASARLA